MALQANALTTVDFIKQLPNSGVENLSDEMIEFYINFASDEIEQYTGRKLKAADYVDERYAGNEEVNLMLNQYPIISVSKVEFIEEGSGFVTFDQLEYRVKKEEGFLYNRFGWRRLAYSSYLSQKPEFYTEYISVDYRAGYETIPANLQMAVGMLIRNRLFADNANSEGLLNYKISDIQLGYGETGKDKIMTVSVKQLLNKYRRRRV